VFKEIKYSGYWLAGLALFLQIQFSDAQHVSATLDTGNIRIGEQATVILRVWTDGKHDPVKIGWPMVSDTLIKNIQVVKVFQTGTLRPDKEHQNGELGQEKRIVVTSFDSGYYAIPPFRFVMNGDTIKPLLTEAMLLHVQGMKVDTTIAIKDIKQPLEEPFDWHELIPTFRWVGLGLIALVVVIIAIIYLVRKKRAAPIKLIPLLPPHITALDSLEKLQGQKLWQEGKLKEYHSTLTDIIRQYIEQRFLIHALEQTSDEILSSFKSIDLPSETRARLYQLLKLADMVKFARQHALPDENEMSMINAKAFVEETKQEQFVAPIQSQP
jgi:hypothetical protein